MRSASASAIASSRNCGGTRYGALIRRLISLISAGRDRTKLTRRGWPPSTIARPDGKPPSASRRQFLLHPGWHRVTFYGDLREPLKELAAAPKLRLVEEA